MVELTMSPAYCIWYKIETTHFGSSVLYITASPVPQPTICLPLESNKIFRIIRMTIVKQLDV